MRLAVIADIHGNALALEAVLADIQRRGGTDLIIDLGDVVSGPLWPRETLDRLDATGAPRVRGNHDRVVGTASRAAMGLSDGFAHDRLDTKRRSALASMPSSCQPLPHCLAFHGTPSDDELYLLDSIEDGRLVRAPLHHIAKRLGHFDPTITLVLCGHSHRPDLVQLLSGPLILNPGSVGCPAYDDAEVPAHVSEAGSAHARYAIIDDVDDPKRFRVSFIALAYDSEGAARRAEENDRPDWAYALRTGTMPPAGGTPFRQVF